MVINVLKIILMYKKKLFLLYNFYVLAIPIRFGNPCPRAPVEDLENTDNCHIKHIEVTKTSAKVCVCVYVCVHVCVYVFIS